MPQRSEAVRRQRPVEMHEPVRTGAQYRSVRRRLGDAGVDCEAAGETDECGIGVRGRGKRAGRSDRADARRDEPEYQQSQDQPALL